AGASYREVPLGEDFAYDLVAVAAAISPNTKIVYLANPNNPTGTKFGRAALERFLDLVPEETLVVLDEAYFEFAAEDPEY
ncbi:aminotransferase class I/II-fold pyridoxal phosphate-dependent enzyme, partial [Escherichia coli]|uniref:aminotransferase class I/II-fold pyridoxal phosphate-dependent enzyme n=1 Tax=Escherichia coli TaxID=562 RepID=UPI0039DFA20E